MAVQYNKLWKLLVDKKMSKADLRKLAEISSNTMTKLRRDEMVALPILDRICEALNVDYGDIIEHVVDRNQLSILRFGEISIAYYTMKAFTVGERRNTHGSQGTDTP